MALLAAGCASDPAGLAPPTLLATSVDDGADAVSPTRAIVLRFSVPLDGDTLDATAIAVVEGVADEALARSLGRDVPTAATRPRLVPGAVFAAGPEAWWEPLRPLAPDALHTLVVTPALRAGGLRLERPALRPFATGDAATGAPSWTLVAPAPGEAGVPRNLRAVEIAFSRPVTGVDEGSLLLVGPRGAVDASVGAGSCATCFSLSPRGPLDGEGMFSVLAGAPIAGVDGEAPFSPGDLPAFATAATERTVPPALSAPDLETSSGCLVARFATDVAAAGTLCLDGACVDEGALVLRHELSAPLGPGATAQVRLAARDLSTAPPGTIGPLPSPPSSPRPLVVAEVLARPRGPRLAQQWVELWNRGGAPVSTDGLELHAARGANQLPSALLAPGERALIVPADFAPDDGDDVPPAPGTLLLRVAERHLGAAGLRTGGETLAITEADGRTLSRFSTEGIAVAPGQSVSRAGACDVAASFRATPGGGATPGAP